jgi:hypothetical protein
MSATVEAERIAAAPVASAPEYTRAYLELIESHPIDADVRVPLRTLGIPFAGAISHPVTLSFGIHSDLTASEHAHEAIILHWEARSPFLPDFLGTLRFENAAHDRTRLILHGTYEPPLEPLGALFDRLIGHHIALATARDLLAKIGNAIEEAESNFRAAHGAPRPR